MPRIPTFKIEAVKRSEPSFPSVFIYSGLLSEEELHAASPGESETRVQVPAAKDQMAQITVADTGQQPVGGEQRRIIDLHITYEQPSPKLSSDSRGDFSPFSYSLIDENQALLSCSQGLPERAIVDEQSLILLWGSAIALIFPDIHKMEIFISGLRGVTVERKAVVKGPE